MLLYPCYSKFNYQSNNILDRTIRNAFVGIQVQYRNLRITISVIHIKNSRFWVWEMTPSYLFWYSWRYHCNGHFENLLLTLNSYRCISINWIWINLMLSLTDALLKRNNNTKGTQVYTNKNCNILDKTISVKPTALQFISMHQVCETNSLFNFYIMRLNRRYFTLKSKIFLR